MAKKTRKKAVRENMTTGRKNRHTFFKTFMILLLLAVLTAVGAATLVYFDIVNIPAINDFLLMTGIKEDKVLSGLKDLYDSELFAPPDAEAYFEENSKIIGKNSANDSDTVPDEAGVYKDLSERGFKDFPINTVYSMKGEYHEETEISDSSSSKHPVYYTYFVTDDEDVWTIFVVNGAIIANPVSYNTTSGNDIQTIVTESDTVMSYDNSTHMFYETIPSKSALTVKKVQRINAETLEKLNFEALER